MSVKRVLHVDDDRERSDIARRVAARDEWGFELSSAESAEEGLEQLHERRVDCVVASGLEAPDGRPFVLAARQRAPRVPIVLLSESSPGTVAADAADEVTRFEGAADRRGVETALRYAASLIRGDGDDPELGADWCVVETCNPDDVDDLTLALSEAVEALVGTGATRQAPLFEAIDTEALEGVLTSASGGESGSVQVQFRYHDYQLLVAGDGTIAARAATA